MKYTPPPTYFKNLKIKKQYIKYKKNSNKNIQQKINN